MKILICISSKSPNSFLYRCIENLYKIQIEDSNDYKICIIDSNSDDISCYDIIIKDFPDVEIYFIKNLNWEYGAWVHSYIKYPMYDIYFCIQDSLIIKKKLDINIVNNNNSCIFYHESGYNSHIWIKQKGLENLKNSNFNNEEQNNIINIIHTDFTVAQYSSFIVTNYIIQNLFNTLRILPYDKDGSCFFERNIGIFFIIKKLNTFNIQEYFDKFYSNRP